MQPYAESHCSSRSPCSPRRPRRRAPAARADPRPRRGAPNFRSSAKVAEYSERLVRLRWVDDGQEQRLVRNWLQPRLQVVGRRDRAGNSRRAPDWLYGADGRESVRRRWPGEDQLDSEAPPDPATNRGSADHRRTPGLLPSGSDGDALGLRGRRRACAAGCRLTRFCIRDRADYYLHDGSR
jgi:hypothetical protein